MQTAYRWGDPTRRPLFLLDALEGFGCEFGLDLDGTLTFEVPAEGITPYQLVEFIRKHEAGIADRIADRAKMDRRVYHGGPLHGQKYGYAGSKKFITFKAGPAKWVVYKLDDEHRAIFQGYASSQKRGRLGQTKPAP